LRSLSSTMTNDLPATRWTGKCRKVIHATCMPYRGPASLTNLVVSTCGGQIELDPHIVGARKVTLDEDGARVLRGTLTAWLG